jgi:hypothetical protein
MNGRTQGVKGDVVFELYPDLAPKTVAAFKQWADMGLYDGTAFHRVATFGSTCLPHTHTHTHAREGVGGWEGGSGRGTRSVWRLCRTSS